MRHRTIGGLALLVVALLVAACGGTPQTSGPPTPTTVSVSPPTPTPTRPLLSAGTVSAMIPGLGAISLQDDGYGMAAERTAVWVYNGETGNLFRIDPATNQVVATISVGLGCAPHAACGGVAIGQSAVWVMASAASKLVRVDPQSNQIVATIPFPVIKDQALNVFVTPGAVWVTDYYDNTIFRIDPATNKVVATLTPFQGPQAVAFGAGSLWECETKHFPDGLTRLDPTTMQVQAQFDVSANQGLSCFGVVALDQAVWVTSATEEIAVLVHIDPATNNVVGTTPIPGTNGAGFAADAQGEWELDSQSGLFRFDPQRGQVLEALPLTGGLGLALGAGSVWVAKGDGTLLRITPAA